MSLQSAFQKTQTNSFKRLFLLFLTLNCSWIYCSGQDDYYWIGDSGDWSDLSHWATTSGGTQMHSRLPSPQDNVFFDSNSFSLKNETIYLDIPAQCNDLTFSGIIENAYLEGNELNVYGSLALSSNLITELTYLSLQSDQPDATLWFNKAQGKIEDLLFEGTGTYTLQDSLVCENLTLSGGILDLNDQPIYIKSALYTDVPDTAQLLLRSSKIYVGGWYISDGSYLMFNAGSSIIYVHSYFQGANHNYNQVIFDAPSSTVYVSGSNTYKDFIVSPGTALNFLSGTNPSEHHIQGDLILSGTKAHPISMSSLTGGQFSLVKSSGQVLGSYLSIQDVNATGGAEFTAYKSIDLGNNNGWNIRENGDYYWIGNGGNWSDSTHWAMQSGGELLYLDLPTQFDNVFFDQHSFSSSDQVVNLDVNGFCANIDWEDVNDSTTISGVGDFFVYGSLTMSPIMNYDLSNVELLADSVESFVKSNGNSLGDNCILKIKGDKYMLSDAYKGFRINHLKGIFFTDNHNVDVESFILTGSNPRYLQLQNSIVSTDTWRVNGENILISSGSSVIKAREFHGDQMNTGPFYYYDVDLYGQGTLTGSSYFHSLNFTSGAQFELESGAISYTDSLRISGNIEDTVFITSTVSGSYTSIEMTSGMSDVRYASLSDLHGVGGGTFLANHSKKGTNVQGWIFDQHIIFDMIEEQFIGSGTMKLNARATSSLPVSYDILSGPVHLDTITNTLTFTSTGMVSIKATQSGDSCYLPAEPVTRQFRIYNAEQTISFPPISNKTYGDPDFDLVATASSGLSVSFKVLEGPAKINGNKVSIIGTGKVVIEALQAGNIDFPPASAIQSFEVKKADQTITFESIGDQEYGVEDFRLNATASSGLDVQFEVLNGSAFIQGDTISILNAGIVEIAASQEGNENYLPADDVIEIFSVDARDQHIQFDSIENKTYGDEDFILFAEASSGLKVSYSIVSGPIVLAGDTVIILGTGIAKIIASQEGSPNYKAATSSRTFVIEKADQFIDFKMIPDLDLQVVSEFPLEVEASSGLKVDLQIEGPALLQDSLLIPLEAGRVTITAWQPGNSNYNAAESIVQAFDIVDGTLLNETVFMADDLHLTPQPARDLVCIRYKKALYNKLLIYDGSGKLVLETKDYLDCLDVSNFKAGLYLIQFFNDKTGQMTSKKMLIH